MLFFWGSLAKNFFNLVGGGGGVKRLIPNEREDEERLGVVDRLDDAVQSVKVKGKGS